MTPANSRNRLFAYTLGMHINVDRGRLGGWATGVAGVLVLLGTLGSSIVSAQPAKAGAATPMCSTLLTAEELTTVIGEKMQDMGARERAAGETECPWMLRGGSSGFKTVSVQFYDLSNIKGNSNAATPDAFFEMLVSSAEGVASGKREMLTGIGKKAAFVPATPQVLAVVARPDGVARIVGNNLTKAQITAVAKAVATP
jgi:hypothetical protein